MAKAKAPKPSPKSVEIIRALAIKYAEVLKRLADR